MKSRSVKFTTIEFTTIEFTTIEFHSYTLSTNFLLAQDQQVLDFVFKNYKSKSYNIMYKCKKIPPSETAQLLELKQ